MFLRIVKDSFARQSRRKILTAATLALGTAVATATLSVALDVGDRMASEFRSLGANLLVTPQADTLPLEIGGVDYRPVDTGAYLPEADLGKLKTIFWRNNVTGFAPFLDVPVSISKDAAKPAQNVTLIGTWFRHEVPIPDNGGTFTTGISSTNPGWSINGRWFGDGSSESVVGTNLARSSGISVGQTIAIASGSRTLQSVVTGIVSTSGPEDNAVLAPLSFAQEISGHEGRYRRLLVSALTKPEDAFSQRDPEQMTPVEFDRWYCSPYISSISLQMHQQLAGVEVRPIRQVAEGEGRILTRVGSLMWLVTAAALLAAALAVAATAGTTVLERADEIGVMKAIGAPRLMVGAFFLGEQWLIALVGGTAGYLAGLVLARLLGVRVFGVPPGLHPILLPIILGVAAVVATIGSVFPLRRVLQLEPASVLRGE
jgi:putative ABC transport system permease protein